MNFHNLMRGSEDNLDARISCVNAFRPISLSLLSNHNVNPENEGSCALVALLAAHATRSALFPVADYPQMNFIQMHDRLRLELLRRIQLGSLSVSLLSRQTGFGQSHLSNFLHNRRQLSLEAMDRILAAQHMAAGDLLPANAGFPDLLDTETSYVPVVSHTTAMHEPFVRPSAAQRLLHLPPSFFQTARARASVARRAWQRFVAVSISAEEALPMDPVVQPGAIALIDRHYNSLLAYRSNRQNISAIRHESHLKLRYADYTLNRLVLRPHNLAFPVELIHLEAEEVPGDLITGRIVLILNEL